MSKKSNDSIEEFFKKGVRKSDITFRESDWQKMERMLDDKAMVGPASTSRSLKRIISVALIVALLSSVYFLIPDRDDQTSSSKQTDQLSKTTEVNGEVSAGNQKEIAADKSHSKKELASNAPVKEPSAITPENTTASKTSKQNNAHVISTEQKQAVNQQKSKVNQQRQNEKSALSNSKKLDDVNVIHVNSGRSDNSASDRTGATTESVIEKNDTGDTDQISNTTLPMESTALAPVVIENEKENDRTTRSEILDPSSKQIALSPADNVPNLKEDSIAIEKENEKVVENESAQSETSQDKNEKTITPSRWSVALVVAPEFSSTSLDRQTEPGSAYGLTIGYRILNRLTISAGILKTHKKYVGYGEDYQPPEGYWKFRTNGVVPDEVSGQCSVIEVPLMLQFDVLQKEKSRLFVSGGVSSYRMLDEAYRYQFNEPNDGAADGWSSNQPSSYYFSVGHLSLGYDRRLYRGLYLGIEPYVKIPFKGIGWSNVDLLTMGAYVNVRYKFSKRN